MLAGDITSEVDTESGNMLSGSENCRNPGTISSSLLRRVQENRPEGWHQVVRLYAPLVYYWCLREGLQPADAEDIVQEVFRTVAARVGQFVRVGPDGSFRGWLRTIVRNKIGNFLRQSHRRIQSEKDFCTEKAPHCALPPAASDGGEGGAHPAETHLLCLQVLELVRTEFEEQTWRAFWRVVADGVPAGYVADEMGISVNAVYLAKSRILRRVRDEMSCDATLPDPR